MRSISASEVRGVKHTLVVYLLCVMQPLDDDKWGEVFPICREQSHVCTVGHRNVFWRTKMK